MSLAVSLRSRGATGSAERATKVLSRFGATAHAMIDRLDRYDAITAEFGVRPTWPTTACVLRRHPSVLRRYAERGIEIALHGLVHSDHKLMDIDAQRAAIGRAVTEFTRHGLSPVGFRGPYLRYNDATLDVLRELGLRYHSSQAFAFPVFPDGLRADRSRYEMALEFYGAWDASRVRVVPRLAEGLVDIPVAVPDDEMLTERLDLDEDGRVALWRSILERTYTRGELCTLQLHPERIRELGSALSTILSEARARVPRVHIARLDELAAWWVRRARFQVTAERTGDRRHVVTVIADRDATVLVRGGGVRGEPWTAEEVRVQASAFGVESERAPLVAVSRRSPAAVGALLDEEGFAWERSDSALDHGAFIDAPDGFDESVLAQLERSPGPLVRIGRWPDGARSALAITGDIDALTLRDFVLRFFETRGNSNGGGHRDDST